jgi:hypothetical protein
MKLVGERRAIAAAVLSFFMLELILAGIIVDDELRAVRLGLGAAYLVAFLGVVSGWFWARWYTLGLGFSGFVLAVLTAWNVGLVPEVFVIGGGHLALGIGLLGDEAAAFYDGRKDWRERWKMDQNAVNRLGKAIMRAGASIPYLIVAGLGPKGGMAVGLAALLLGVAGFSGLVRLRTWGLLLLGAGAIVSAANPGVAWHDVSGPAAWLAAALLGAAVLPFFRPMLHSLRKH